MRKLTILLLLSVTLGCAAQKHPEVWVFRNCMHNKDREVCTCSKWHEEINARNGAKVKVCQ